VYVNILQISNVLINVFREPAKKLVK